MQTGWLLLEKDRRVTDSVASAWGHCARRRMKNMGNTGTTREDIEVGGVLNSTCTYWFRPSIDTLLSCSVLSGGDAEL